MFAIFRRPNPRPLPCAPPLLPAAATQPPVAALGADDILASSRATREGRYRGQHPALVAAIAARQERKAAAACAVAEQALADSLAWRADEPAPRSLLATLKAWLMSPPPQRLDDGDDAEAAELFRF